MRLIYRGPHDEVRFADTGQIAARNGEPVDRDDHEALRACRLDDGGPQWIEFVPEPQEWHGPKPRKRTTQ